MRPIYPAILILLASVSPATAEVMSIDESAKLFGSRQDSFAADLSPLGDKVVFLSATGGSKTTVKLLDLATSKVTSVVTSDGKPEQLSWCEFASETKIVCRFGGNVAVDNVIARLGRLVTIDLEKNQLKSLGVRETTNDVGLHQEDGAILDWLPDEKQGAVLMARQYVAQKGTIGSNLGRESAGGLGVDRIDLTSLRSTVVEPPLPFASNYMTDARGTVRLMALDVYKGDQWTGRTKYRYRPAGSASWRDLGMSDDRAGTGMQPLAIDRASDTVYYLQKLDGRQALYSMKLDGAGVEKLVAKNSQVDIDGIVRITRGSPIIGYAFTDDRPRIVYFDPDYSKLAASLGRALPNSPLTTFAGASRDGTKLLVHGASDRDAGVYYLLDRTSRETHAVLLNRPELEGKTLAPVRSISYAAADGVQVPAYITMRADGPTKNLPAVVLPHGGPTARDEWGFDWIAQFLASRGYVVIQPQYRGSAGYGDTFRGDNAFRDWKTAMSDIRDAAQYLVSQGTADPKRMAILGWSYGGYAALQSATIDPDRYKAVIAIAPVTDLSALRLDAEGFTNSDLEQDFIGKGTNLQSGSPLRHAAAIKAPVLLVHGTMDNNVRVAHSDRMAAALKQSGKSVEYLRYKGLEHQLDDSDTRIEVLTHVAALLERTIGH